MPNGNPSKKGKNQVPKKAPYTEEQKAALAANGFPKNGASPRRPAMGDVQKMMDSVSLPAFVVPSDLDEVSEIVKGREAAGEMTVYPLGHSRTSVYSALKAIADPGVLVTPSLNGFLLTKR
jgi:hypothetical protein